MWGERHQTVVLLTFEWNSSIRHWDNSPHASTYHTKYAVSLFRGNFSCKGNYHKRILLDAPLLSLEHKCYQTPAQQNGREHPAGDAYRVPQNTEIHLQTSAFGMPDNHIEPLHHPYLFTIA